MLLFQWDLSLTEPCTCATMQANLSGIGRCFDMGRAVKFTLDPELLANYGWAPVPWAPLPTPKAADVGHCHCMQLSETALALIYIYGPYRTASRLVLSNFTTNVVYSYTTVKDCCFSLVMHRLKKLSRRQANYTLHFNPEEGQGQSS